MNAKTFEFFEAVEHICQHPKGNTLNGTFGEVIALLEGFAQSAVIFRNRGHHALAPFQKFLSKQEKFKGVGNFVDWKSFYEVYQDDELAIKELLRLLKEFRGKVFEIEDIGIDIWIEESNAAKIHSVLSEIEFSDEDLRKEAILELKKKLEEELELQPLRKMLRWKPDTE